MSTNKTENQENYGKKYEPMKQDFYDAIRNKSGFEKATSDMLGKEYFCGNERWVFFCSYITANRRSELYEIFFARCSGIAIWMPGRRSV